MRFVSEQLARLLEGDLWLENARHANAMARRLADGLADIPAVSLAQPVQATAVFARVPAGVIDDLRREFFFHVWDAGSGVVRWMCSWQTEPGDVDRFLAALRRAAGASSHAAR